jgi:hypothetical protein
MVRDVRYRLWLLIFKGAYFMALIGIASPCKSFSFNISPIPEVRVLTAPWRMQTHFPRPPNHPVLRHVGLAPNPYRVRTECVLTCGDYMGELGGGVVDAETLCPMPSAGIPRRAETEPDSHDVLSTVGRADSDVECPVSGIRIVPLRYRHGSGYLQKYTC